MRLIDNGPGIPAGQLERVFDRFHRVGEARVQYASWRWLFFFVLPFAALTAVVAARFLNLPRELTRPRLDLLSVLLSTVGFGTFIYGVCAAGTAGVAMLPGGVALAALGLAARAFVIGKTDSPLPVLLVYTAVMWGMPCALTPIQTNSLSGLPAERYPHGTAIMNTLQMIAAAFGSFEQTFATVGAKDPWSPPAIQARPNISAVRRPNRAILRLRALFYSRPATRVF